MKPEIMKQWNDAKHAAGNEVLLIFRMGDFYELFSDDARTASRVLGLTLIQSARADGVPMVGFPYYQIDNNLKTLKRAGYRFAICDPN